MFLPKKSLENRIRLRYNTIAGKAGERKKS